MVMRYKFNLSTYVQEPLVIGRRGCTGRDLNEETLAADNGRQQSSEKAVAYESDVSEGVQGNVLYNKIMI
jgi:hypothetical protein